MSRSAIPFTAGIFVSALFAAAWAVSAPQTSSHAPQTSTQTREARSLKVVCGRCHNLQLVTNTPKSYDAWHETVQKMVDRGAKGTDAQFDDIMDYLHRTVTTIDVNSADPDELGIVLHVSDTTAQAIVARRTTKKIAGPADLKSIPGVDASIVDSKARMIFFN